MTRDCQSPATVQVGGTGPSTEAHPSLADDPLSAGLDDFARRFRARDLSARVATAAYLERIAAVNDRLQAFSHVAVEDAMKTAAAIDALFEAGVDLGPLMGVPVAIKDIFAVEGLPLTVGSTLDLARMVGAQGEIVTRIRRQGAVILGMTRAVECALGPMGISMVQPTPRNPWDIAVHRLPGGSSSGSGVAMAAGLCALALGSDTGGSVRIPAALNGCAGMKTSVGRWPTDGISVLSPTLDSVGVLTRTAADAAYAVAAIEAKRPMVPMSLEGLRIGTLDWPFLEDDDGVMVSRYAAALATIRSHGAVLRPFAMPEFEERQEIMPTIVNTELIALLGRERFLGESDRMDPIVWHRAKTALEITADRYQQAIRRREILAAQVQARLEDVDVLVSPSMPFTAPTLPDLSNPERMVREFGRFTRNSQPANMFDLCALTIPLPGPGLPQGLQVMAGRGKDHICLRVGIALEGALGLGTRPNVSGFAA